MTGKGGIWWNHPCLTVCFCPIMYLLSARNSGGGGVFLSRLGSRRLNLFDRACRLRWEWDFPEMTESSTCSNDCQPLTDGGLHGWGFLRCQLGSCIRASGKQFFAGRFRFSEYRWFQEVRAAVWVLRRLAKHSHNHFQGHLDILQCVARSPAVVVMSTVFSNFAPRLLLSLSVLR